MQFRSQENTQQFITSIQNEWNNYFKAHSEDVYSKLLKAAQFVDSNDSEDHSLLLTQVRRAMDAEADQFYPASDQAVTCSDGRVRALGKDQFLNRLDEFIATPIAKSSSRDLLSAELQYLSVFARRLNAVASKGVHSDVTPEEAKQGLLGLYMFLYNVISRLQRDVP